MDWRAAKSYYIAYRLSNRYESIVIFYNYLCTWSIAIGVSLILPLLFVLAPSSLRTSRTSHLYLVCLVCLSNMCCVYVLPYMISGSGEPNLPLHTCRFIVYVSTLAKPVGLYLTFLFGIERICTKNLSKLIRRTNYQRQYFKKISILLIIVVMFLILSTRLYQVLSFIRTNQSFKSNSSSVSQDENIDNTNDKTTDQMQFRNCYRSLDFKIYANIVSFYLIQYWFEYVTLGMIVLNLLYTLIYHYWLPLARTYTPSKFSVNTKLYVCLSTCVVLFEVILLTLHFIIIREANDNTDTQANALQAMLFIYNLRCILLPVIVCFSICDPFKDWLYQLIIQRPYLDNLDQDEQTKIMIDRTMLFSSSQ